MTSLHLQQQLCVFINVLGGVAVLASYAIPFVTSGVPANALWGNVPEGLRPFYALSMILAAIGYFAFSYLIILQLNPDETRVLGALPYAAFLLIYCLILFPSVMWMPLTVSMIGSPASLTFIVIRVVLFVVGLSSFALVLSLLTTSPRPIGISYWFAVVGAGWFCFHTLILDAIIWPHYFSILATPAP